MRARLTALALSTCSAIVLAAQQPASDAPQAPVFRTSADLVTVDAVVTDDDGRHVTDLSAADFEVTVSGKKQALLQALYVRTADQPRVLAAARAPRAPGGEARSEASMMLKRAGLQPDRIARTIALVVDDLGLSFRSALDVRGALHTYIDTQMQPGDLVAIVRTAGGVGTLQQFTTDKRLLHMAAEHVQWDFRSRYGVVARGSVDSGGVSRVPDLHTEDLRDAMASRGSLSALAYIARGVAELPGRKCIVFLSDGFDRLFEEHVGSGSIWRAMTQMLGQANAAGVVVYTIAGGGLETGGLTAEDNPQRIQTGIQGTYDAESLVRDTAKGRMNSLLASQESLQFIAKQTGGLAVADTNDFNRGLSRVLADQQGYYLLSYSAPSGAPRSGWDQNRVKVRVKRRGLHVRARQGFFGPSDPNTPETFTEDTLTTAALSPFAASGMTVRLTSMFGNDMKQGAYVRSLLFIDPNDLRFELDPGGRHTATFQVKLLAVGENGEVLAAWSRLVPLVLDQQQYHVAKERGIVYTVRTSIKQPGAYQMRAAVRDEHTALTGSASHFVEVPKVGAGQLVLSSVVLTDVAEAAAPSLSLPAPEAAPEGLAEALLLQPEVRVLEAGTDAAYSYEVYDGLKPVDADHLEMGTALIRGGKIVYQSPFTPVTAAARAGATVRVIPIAGKLELGKDMPPGSYTLEVVVRGKDPKKLDRRQWVDFELR